jgi:hypothetical protein
MQQFREFVPQAVHEGVAAEKVLMEQVLLPTIIIPPMFYADVSLLGLIQETYLRP